MADRSATPRRRLTREDWVSAALTAIAEGGLATVAVEPLAARLGTTKGSFYWHFPNRDALLAASLAAWEDSTTTAVLAEVEQTSGPIDQLRLLISRVVDIAERDPIGLALLGHAGHPVVGPALTRVTRHRIDGTVRIFRRLGFAPAEARRRALFAYSAYLGHAQLAQSTPAVLPHGKAGRQGYLDHVLNALTTAP